MNANTHLIHAIADALIHAHGEDATDGLEGGRRAAVAHGVAGWRTAITEGTGSTGRCTQRRAAPMSEPPRDGAATTGISVATSRRRTSGSGPSARTGGEP